LGKAVGDVFSKKTGIINSVVIKSGGNILAADIKNIFAH
jgi:hypothetical protein